VLSISQQGDFDWNCALLADTHPSPIHPKNLRSYRVRRRDCGLCDL